MFYARRIPDPDKSPPSRWKLNKYIVSTDSNERINRCGPVGSGGHGVPANGDEQGTGSERLHCPLAFEQFCCVPGAVGSQPSCFFCGISRPAPSVWPRLLNHILNSLLLRLVPPCPVSTCFAICLLWQAVSDSSSHPWHRGQCLAHRRP